MLRLIVSATLALCLLPIAWAAPHRLRVHPNSSLTILSIAEGPDGFLWLGATDGVYRYDGFHYHKITSYPFSSARFTAFTSDGSLWCGDFEGLVRFRDNRFEIVTRESVISLAAFPDQVIAKLRQDLLRIRVDGSTHRVANPTRRDFTIDPSGKLWAVCIDPQRACWMDPKQPETPHSIELPGALNYQQVAADSRGRIWAADLERAVLIENGRETLKLQRQRSLEGSRAAPLLNGRKGQLWFLGDTIQALNSKIEFHDRVDNERFEPMGGLEDSGGHLWIASVGRGLLEWIPDPEWHRWFPENLANEASVQVIRDARGGLILGTQKNIYRQEADRWTPLAGSEQLRYDALFPLGDGGFLASIRKLGLARLSPEGRIVERVDDPQPLNFEHREMVRDGKGRLWAGTKLALLRIEGQPGSLRLRHELLPDLADGLREQAVDLEVDSAGRLWAGYDAGIAWLDDQDQWHKIATDRPVTLVRSFTLAGDDIWVAHRVSGAFSRLRRNGDLWNVTLFSANAGYGPVDSDFIKRDSRGWIWRGSPKGLHIADGRHFSPNDWIHIDPGNGLASSETNQYGFFEDTDGSVWIAGEEGVSHLRPNPAWFDAPHAAPPPRVTRVEADGKMYVFPEKPPAALPSATRILRIDVGSLHSPAFRDYPLRYRLLPLSKEWQISRDGTLEFANLPENAYTLELGYTGNGASAVGAYPFRIGPGGSAFNWLWVTGLLLASGALVPVVGRAAWADRARFRIEKAVFLLRRRHGYRNLQSPSDGTSAARDYSGETVCSRYGLIRILSRGGFSVVYEARDTANGNALRAVKILNRTAGGESWIRDRFAHEVAALRSVQHPGVVPILDSWISPAGEPCLAMPYLDGQTLRAALNQLPFSAARGARIIRQLGAALGEVHSRGIIHRDLKPENLMLLSPGTDREQLVILDFGTAGLRSGDNELAATTLMAGSFYYMAPERLTGRYSPASDVFSLGVIVLEMLTGKRLAELRAMFSDPSFRNELAQVLRTVVEEDAAKVLAECLAPAFDPEPRRRPTDVKRWADEVAAALDQE